MRGWFVSPKQNDSFSKNNYCERKNSFLPDNYCINASTKNTDTPECLLNHNIIFSRPKSKALNSKKSPNLDKKNVWKIVSLSSLP